MLLPSGTRLCCSTEVDGGLVERRDQNVKGIGKRTRAKKSSKKCNCLDDKQNAGLFRRLDKFALHKGTLLCKHIIST